MAYWSAQFRDDDQLLAVGREITDLELWKRYVGSTWESLGQALVDLPVTDLTTPALTLQQAARGIARWVAESLRIICFRHIIGADGEAFFIDRYDFPT